MFSMFSCWIYLQKAKNLLPFSFFFFFFFFFLWSAVSAQYFSSSDFSFPLDETTFSIDNKLFYVKTGLVFFGSGGVPYSLNLTSPNGTMVSLFANENVVQQSSGQFMTFYDLSNTSLSSVPSERGLTYSTSFFSKPVSPFLAFNGENPDGVWKLTYSGSPPGPKFVSFWGLGFDSLLCPPQICQNGADCFLFPDGSQACDCGSGLYGGFFCETPSIFVEFSADINFFYLGYFCGVFLGSFLLVFSARCGRGGKELAAWAADLTFSVVTVEIDYFEVGGEKFGYSRKFRQLYILYFSIASTLACFAGSFFFRLEQY